MWPIIAMGVSTGIDMFASYKQGEAAKDLADANVAKIEMLQEQNRYNEERAKAKANIDYSSEFLQRLEGYNMVRGQQIALVGYQGRTIDSVKGVQEAGEADYNYDIEISKINKDLLESNITIQANHNNAILEADKQIAKAGGDVASTQQSIAITSDALSGATDIIKYTS